MKTTLSLLVAACFAALAAAAQTTGHVQVVFSERLGPLNVDRMALGQGGLSAEPMWDGRVAEVRALRPALIRLFLQEYFDLLPERGRYHFDTLDHSVDTILAAGAQPLMCLCFKPRALFPEINQDLVELLLLLPPPRLVCGLRPIRTVYVAARHGLHGPVVEPDAAVRRTV